MNGPYVFVNNTIIEQFVVIQGIHLLIHFALYTRRLALLQV